MTPRPITLLLLLLAALATGCIEPEQVELLDEDEAARNTLLAACGESVIRSIEPKLEAEQDLLAMWREEYQRLLAFGDEQWDDVMTVTGLEWLDGRLLIDYYYLKDWIFVRFSFQTALSESDSEARRRSLIVQALLDGDFAPLPDGETEVVRIEESVARVLLQNHCSVNSLRAACPDVRFDTGRLIYYPFIPGGENTLDRAAVDLSGENICCNGLQAECRDISGEI